MGISISTVIRRYNRLKGKGLIRSLIQINPAKIGYHAEACFRVKTDIKLGLNDIAEKIAEIPDVRGILKTSGSYDLIIFAAIRNLEDLFAFETEIANILGVRQMEPAILNHFPILPYPREHISTF